MQLRCFTSWAFPQEADARYSAGHLLSAVAWLHPEYREKSLALLTHAEQLFRQVVNWHGVGVSLFGQVALLNDSHPGIERQDARVAALLEQAAEAFRHAGRPTEEADAMLMQARLAGLHGESTERFVDLCCAAFAAYERGRANLLLPTEREYRDQRTSYSVSFLGSNIWDLLRANPTQQRSDSLVWGLEQLVKGRSLQDQQMAPKVWQRFLTKDDQLRELTERLEWAQHSLEGALRHGDPADAARLAVDHARRMQRERLENVAADAATELELTSVPAVSWRAMQASMSPGEMYVGLVMCGREGRFLRTQLTSTDARFDAVEAPDLLLLLIRQRNGEQLSPAELAVLHRSAYNLLGLPASGVDTLVICPDRHLVAVPWHLVGAEADRPPLNDRMAIGIVPAAGAWAQWAGGAASSPDDATEGLSYLGVSDGSGDLEYVDVEVENIRNRYFPARGRCWTTGQSHRLLTERGHVGLLHIASHAFASGFVFSGRIVTPIDLADLQLTADVLLLTGCYLGAFGDDESNEFLGVTRQLLIATRARAAVASLDPVPDEAGPLFSELVVSAMTGQGHKLPWALPAGRMNVGDAVRWARRRMCELTDLDAWRLQRNPSGLTSGVPPRIGDTLGPSWWAPWLVLGDPQARLDGCRYRSRQMLTDDGGTPVTGDQVSAARPRPPAINQELHSYALDMLQRTLKRQHTEERWAEIQAAINTSAEALQTGDIDTFQGAVSSLGSRRTRFTDIGNAPAPEQVREEINVLIHTLDGMAEAEE